MAISEFLSHVRESAPGFRCFDCADPSDALQFLARVTNALSLPADSEALASIDTFLGAAGGHFKQLYRHHDGLILYQDSRSDAAGVELYPIRQWSDRSEEVREEFDWLEAHMPKWMADGVAFGEIPHSGNYFMVQVAERNAGTIYYLDHDAWRESPVAENLEELLTLIRTDPADFLYERGCYTRYSDGETDIQWIPKEYVAECR